jgi:hypothetical protein
MYCTVTLGTVITRMLFKRQIETLHRWSLLLVIPDYVAPPLSTGKDMLLRVVEQPERPLPQ